MANQHEKSSRSGSGAFWIEKLPGQAGEARIALLHFDLQGEKVNKFSRAVMGDFERLLGDLDVLGQKEEIDALVVVSDKPGNFIAGADITLIQSSKSQEEATGLSASGQALLNRWEDLPFVKVAAIDGACMGGGCELSLASNAIVMSNAPTARIGLPEVMLGVVPGMGGCVRLPAKIGIAGALDMILTGKTLTGDRALKAGLAEACIPQENFRDGAVQWVRKNLKALKAGDRLAREPKLGGIGGVAGSLMENNPIGRSVMFSKAKEGVLKKTKGHYPAPLEAIAVMHDNGVAYGHKPRGEKRTAAMAREALGFGQMAATPISKNLIRIFFMTEAVKKSKGAGTGVDLGPVRAASVLGAGVMGGGIAQLFADKGIRTRMKDLNVGALGLGIQAANKIFQKQVIRKKITKREFLQKLNLISPVTDFSGFNSSQVVVEAIVEKMEVKQAVLKDLEAYVSDDCVIASNTSSLSISTMQTVMKRPERFAGMHFFNPVAKMPLVEVIRGAKSDDRAVSVIYQLSKQLGKTPIVVKDSPGFLVNRLLMPYLNEATYLLHEGVPIEELDEVLLEFGMPMGPMELIDEVGVDVGDKVAKILFEAFGERMTPSPVNGKIAAAGRLGKKSGKGLYVYEGKEKSVDSEIYPLLGITPQSGKVSPVEILDRCILPMINEACRCLDDNVVASADDVDLGMIMGTGFPPFKGGLLKHADAVGASSLVEKLEALRQRFGARFEPAPRLVAMAKAKTGFYSS